MNNRPTIKVDGLNKAIRELKKAHPGIEKEIKSSNKGLAETLVPVAKSKARKQSGDLAGSVRAGATQRSGVVRAGKKSVPYAGVQHFGWGRRRIRPNPFLWDAMDSRRATIERQYEANIRKIVEGVK